MPTDRPQAIQFEHARVELWGNVAVLNIDEGADLFGEQMEAMLDGIERATEGFYSIVFNEENAYSLQFEALKAISERRRLRRIGIVAYRLVTVGVMRMAMCVANKPHDFFDSVERAIPHLQKDLQRSPLINVI